MTGLTLRDLGVTRGGRVTLAGVTVGAGPGEFVGLIGPNGAGKTTLLRAALGLIPATGHSSLAALPPPTRARTAAWLPQAREIAWPVSVAHLVGLARIANPAAPDRTAAVLDRLDLAALADRAATDLSGGEQARALLARALAQDTPVLLADEPAAGLDPAQQIRTMQLFAGLAGEGRLVVASLHDLGLAVRHCTRLWVMDGGRLVADGPPAAVLTPERLAATFRVTGHMADTPDGPVFQPLAAL